MVIGRRQPPPPSIAALLTRSTVLVNLVDGRTAVSGVLWESDSSGVTLRGGVGVALSWLEELGEAGVKETAVEGEMFIPAAQVKFINVVNRGVG